MFMCVCLNSICSDIGWCDVLFCLFLIFFLVMVVFICLVGV